MIVQSYATVLASRNQRRERGGQPNRALPNHRGLLASALPWPDIIPREMPRTWGNRAADEGTWTERPECRLLFYTTLLALGIIYIYIYIRASIRTEEPSPLPQICPISPL